MCNGFFATNDAFFVTNVVQMMLPYDNLYFQLIMMTENPMLSPDNIIPSVNESISTVSLRKKPS